VVAAPQDIRWGRAYEAYGEDTALVGQLAVAYLRGLQEGTPAILGAPKHYLADGGTAFGSAKASNMGVKYLLDQGEARLDEAALRRVHLPPYQAAVDAGALSIMASFSSWNGVKVHAQKRLLTDILKDELGFRGFLVSDWQAVDQIPGGYHNAVAIAINAGIDMVMVPYDYNRFITTLTQAVESEAVPMARIDDAVRRILTVKFKLGLFERPLTADRGLATIGSAEHRALAREAVRKSLVLLKNDRAALPLAKNPGAIIVAGQAADDIGIQCGGWTIEWQGKPGAITPGTTILAGIRAAVAPATRVEFSADAQFDGQAEVGIAVVGEQPYAEGVGDRASLSLSAADIALIQRLRERNKTLVIVLISGRPLVVTEQLAAADAFVAAWLPGTEGAGVADVLFGDYPFTGKLPYTWPRSNTSLPRDPAPLLPAGFGLEK
jgi:beta-glucosidase